MNLRTIVKKAISTGAISIIIEYVAPNSILSYFKIFDEDIIINDQLINQGDLAFVNDSNLPVSFYINQDGNLIAVGEPEDVAKFEMNDNGNIIYTT